MFGARERKQIQAYAEEFFKDMNLDLTQWLLVTGHCAHKIVLTGKTK